VEQSTSYYSEKLPTVPVLSPIKDSDDPVVEKAQQDPHYPWFFTGETIPLVTQLTSPTKLVAEKVSDDFVCDVGLNPRYTEANSACVISANSVYPQVEPSFLALCVLI
jgi:hypothetical protein